MSGYVGYNPITKVNVFEQLAPTPNQLQRTGALVSQGNPHALGGYDVPALPASAGGPASGPAVSLPVAAPRGRVG